jgi:hypothetical protein
MNPFARKGRGGFIPKPRIDDPASDRRWERRVEVKIDLAACLMGLAVLVLAIACAMNPQSISFPSASQALAGMLIR